MNTHDARLIALLNGKQAKIYEKCKDCGDEMSSIAEREIFMEGFQLGVWIAFEVMNETEESFTYEL